MDFPLTLRTPPIDVREHFGTDNSLAKASRIASYTLDLPKDIGDEALRKARLRMAVKANGEIELIALVDGSEYKSTVKRTEPPFVDEI